MVWVLGTYLHGRGARIVIDEATGRELTMASRHTFFFIPMRYRGPLLLALSILPFIVR